MITKIDIENFQAHRKLSLQLDPHVTCIIGPSDSGKSAIIRAIQWVAFNRPSGDGFRTWDAEAPTKVTLSVTKGEGSTIHVSRIKGSKVNAYHINSRELSAFGTDVPADVISALNVGDINFQLQHDGPFWFSETAGEVSRQLNRIIDLEVIDTTLANLAAAARASKAEVDVCQSRLEDAVAERRALKFARQMDTDLKAVEAKERELAEVRQKRAVLQTHAEDARTYHQAQNNAAQTARGANLAVQAGTRWASCRDRRAELEAVIEDCRKYRKIASRSVPRVDTLEAVFTLYRQATAARASLESLMDTAKAASSDADACRKEAARLTSQFKLQMGDVCKLCGKPLK